MQGAHAHDATHVHAYRPAAWRHILHHIVPTLLINAVAPVLIYALLRPHATELHALMAAALAPLGEGVVTLLRQRKLNVFGAIVFLSLMLSGALVLIGGTPRLILVRESVLSGGMGVALLVSLLWRQPLVYHLARHFIAGNAPARATEFSHKAEAPRFRAFLRLLTIVWGLVTIGDAALNTYLALHVPVGAFLAVSPLARYGVMGGAFAWTLAHAHRGRHLAHLFSA